MSQRLIRLLANAPVEQMWFSGRMKSHLLLFLVIGVVAGVVIVGCRGEFRPRVSAAGSLTVAAEGPDGTPRSNPEIAAWLGSVTASDVEDGNITAFLENDAPVVFPIGVTFVTFSVTDADGRTDSGQGWVRVAVLLSTPEDTSLPIIPLNLPYNPSNLTASGAPGPPHVSLATSSSYPSDGTLVDSGADTLTYTPDPDFSNRDKIIYLICDTTCDHVEVFIDVVPVNDPPVAADDTVSTLVDTPVGITPADGDTDSDGNLDALSVAALSAPAAGSLVNNGDGSLTYTPNPSITGIDSFLYEICDTTGLCDTATVRIEITPPPPPPPPPPPAPVVIDVSGTWSVVITVTNEEGACKGEKGVPYTRTVEIVQDARGGLILRGLGDAHDPWEGNISGARLLFGGTRPDDAAGEGTTTADFDVTLDDDQQKFRGTESWTWAGEGGTCPRGASDVTGSRVR